MTPRETFLTAALALLHTQLCLAQAGGPKDFYGNNYAKTTGDLGTRGAQPVAGAKASTQEVTRSSSGVLSHKESSAADQEAGSGIAKKRRVVVSVVVNSRDKTHFAKVAEEVFSLSDTQAAFVSEVSHIGDYATVTDEVEKECTKRGIFIHQIDSPPKDLSVNTSPAWRVQTKDGVYIVEGILSLGRFIDEWGEFDPKRAQGAGSDLKAEGF